MVGDSVSLFLLLREYIIQLVFEVNFLGAKKGIQLFYNKLTKILLHHMIVFTYSNPTNLLLHAIIQIEKGTSCLIISNLETGVNSLCYPDHKQHLQILIKRKKEGYNSSRFMRFLGIRMIQLMKHWTELSHTSGISM